MQLLDVANKFTKQLQRNCINNGTVLPTLLAKLYKMYAQSFTLVQNPEIIQ
jgi:hypothetical protein